MKECRAQESQFKDFICDAVAPHVRSFSKPMRGVVQSSHEEDTRFSFDLRVGVWLPVSVRLRKNQFLRYRDFSIRSRTRFSGKQVAGEVVTCELDKLKSGMGNCYFYGWLNPAQTRIVDYILVDMNAFRPWLDTGYDERPNRGDGTWARYYSIKRIRDAGALVFDANGIAAADSSSPRRQLAAGGC